MAFFNLPLKRFNPIFIDGDFDPNITIMAESSGNIITNFPQNGSAFNSSRIKSVIFEGTIHIFYQTYHKKYDPVSENWVDVSTIPVVSGIDYTVVVFMDTINIIQEYKHSAFDPSNNTWVRVNSYLPFRFDGGDSVVFNDRLFVMAEGALYGTTTALEWGDYHNCPYGDDFSKAKMIVHNGFINIFGSDGTSAKSRGHYKWNYSNGWDYVSRLPKYFDNDCVIIVNGNINLFIGTSYGGKTNRYKFNDSKLSWYIYEDEIDGINVRNGSAQFFNDEIILLGSVGGKRIQELYKLNIQNNLLSSK